ncbi:ABC transporter substrate-binding protein [Pseudonocardia benzenivorans]|uniref:ABC transporter substrate-binding protein n=1 Tax=Pseudonocardia benzenivorans TaxID=228005 RepID=A0ABW3VBP1_9PSEU|nr:ABC transporter substrate-binding protein [Pseudonocardia dioxanivorans]GJF04832.1 ABC transporter substrate-binding protein [Pseudonocardia sp. D17]
MSSPDPRRRRRRLLSTAVTALLSALLLVLSACGGSATSGGGAGGNTLIIGMTASDIPILDTGLAQGQGYEGLRFVANQLYDGLTKFDLTKGDQIPKIEPDLAESWQPNADLTSWTFKLRPGVTFHDGTPWNADAAIFNLERYADKSSPNFYQELNAQGGLSIAGIKSFSKVDDMTITINTNGPWSYLPVDLATVYFGSPTAIKAEGNQGFAEKPVGTGPFKFESLERGQRLVMTKNASYWNGAPKLDKVILRPIPDPTARVAALRSGEVNWIEVPPPDDVPSLQNQGFQVLTNSYNHIWPWVYNMRKAPFDNQKVREALNWAINRQSLVDNILKGTAEPALGFTPKADASFRPESEVYGYDPAKAKQLLAEAGYPNGFTMTLSYPTSGSGNMVPTPMNTALQADLAAVGVKVELKPIEWAAMLNDFFAGNIPDDANAMNISLSYQQEGFWTSWFGSQSTSNAGKYSNPQVDALLAKARTILDDKQRSDVYAQVAQILGQDSPWLVVVNDKNPRVLSANVKGFVQPQSWFADLTTISIGDSG